MTAARTHLMGSFSIATQLEKNRSPFRSMSPYLSACNDVGQFVKHRIPILFAILCQTENGKTQPDLPAFGAGISRTARQASTQPNRGPLQSILILGKPLNDFGQNRFGLSLEVIDQ